MVLLVVSLLAAMSIPVMTILKRKAAEDSTRALLSQISLAMEAYGVMYWSTNATTPPLNQPMWDLDGNSFLDAQEVVGFDGYSGFTMMAGSAINPKHIKRADNGDQIVDAWGRRIRVASRVELPPGIRFGVFSSGPDKDSATIDDNIYSWK
jgi:type II secretory pathway pseudopilin PulG